MDITAPKPQLLVSESLKDRLGGELNDEDAVSVKMITAIVHIRFGRTGADPVKSIIGSLKGSQVARIINDEHSGIVVEMRASLPEVTELFTHVTRTILNDSSPLVCIELHHGDNVYMLTGEDKFLQIDKMSFCEIDLLSDMCIMTLDISRA